MNREIVRADVVDDEGNTWEFVGAGHMTLVNTLVPGETFSENRPVRYVTITINLPVEA